MLQQIAQLNRATNRHAGKLLAAGLAGALAYNAWQWRREAALARRKRPAQPALARTPKVSALVAAWNEAGQIDAHIQSFLALRYPAIELVICAGGADGTLERARRYAGERVIVIEQQPGEGKQRALARCYAQAGGEIIYLTDADCRFSEDALVRLLAPIVGAGEQAATGTSRPLAEQAHKLLPRYLAAADMAAAIRSPAYVGGLLGRNAAVSRAAIERSGGLDFAARTGTDYQLARRLLAAGIAIRHVGDSCVQSEYPETLGEYRRRQSRWLRNLLLHSRRYGAAGDLRASLQTVVAGLAMLLAPLAALLGGWAIVALWAALVAHALGAKLRYTLFAARVGGRPLAARLALALLPLTLIDFAVWAAPIVDLADPRRREQW
jgi:cellulose synthase/poly-beta-1,6-N-acetylglucosamine synthase-like glycosyltransferase